MNPSPAKILAIDDESMIRETIADYLEDSGFLVLTAADGAAGMALFASEKPDAVLVDLRMPVMDGLEVLSRVREASPDTPVVVISGTGVLADVIQALRLGAWDFLTKPITDLGVLEHTVGKVLERSRLIRENRRYQQNLEERVLRRTEELTELNCRLCREIEERKAREEEIRNSLREKEVLLREIHHRVKNNLQVISSLLSLQARYSRNPDLAEPFRESRNRVRSMAIIHEKLYQSRSLAEIDFAEYLESLTKDIINSYNVNGKRIELKVTVRNAHLEIDQAIPCGLIINELVSNAYKYAFVRSSGGLIAIDYGEDAHGVCRLSVSDNGDGFPRNLDFRRTDTLGLQLVVGLVGQLGGTIELNAERGCRFDVTFKKIQTSKADGHHVNT